MVLGSGGGGWRMETFMNEPFTVTVVSSVDSRLPSTTHCSLRASFMVVLGRLLSPSPRFPALYVRPEGTEGPLRGVRSGERQEPDETRSGDESREPRNETTSDGTGRTLPHASLIH